jgi:hypothetical protein
MVRIHTNHHSQKPNNKKGNRHFFVFSMRSSPGRGNERFLLLAPHPVLNRCKSKLCHALSARFAHQSILGYVIAYDHAGVMAG